MRPNWATSAAGLNLPHHFANLDAPCLMEKQHSARALFLGSELLLRRREQEIGGPRARVGLREGVGARCEQHLAAPAALCGNGRLTITAPGSASSADPACVRSISDY
jgi:hypothetical protein